MFWVNNNHGKHVYSILYQRFINGKILFEWIINTAYCTVYAETQSEFLRESKVQINKNYLMM